MATLQADGLLDLVASTLKDLGEMRITEIATDLQNHVAMRELMRKNRVSIEAGQGLQWDVMVQHSGGASFTGLYATDNVNVGQVLKQATLPWRHSTANYAIDHRELAMNRNPRRIVDLLKIRRIDCMIATAELMETAFWGFPASTDDKTPHGIAYHIVKNSSTGFYGGAQSGYNDVSGLSPTTYPRWRNWTALYTDVSKDDLLPKWREAAVKTNFVPPVDGIPTFNTGNAYGFYTNYGVIQTLESLLEGQNDNLGNDLASKDGATVFKRTPVMYVPKLDADTTGPVYGVNWGVFKTVILQGWWLKELKIENVPGQHTVTAVHIDNTFNWLNRDRRRNFVLATGTGYPG